MRVVLYLRLSATADDSTSIVRQEEDLRTLAEREGWTVVRVLTDDGISGRKARANAAEALRMIRDGEADVLAVWKLDRWTRQGLSAVSGLVDVLDARPEALFVALSDGLRSNQPAWRIIASVLAEVARMEAENTSTRIKSSFVHRKAVGKFTGGPIPYGYRSAPAPDGVGRILIPELHEAAVVRSVAAGIVEGASLARLARELTASGEPTSKSPYRLAVLAGDDPEGLARGLWTAATIRNVWSSEHLLGRARHHGRSVRGDDGLPVAFFDPILDLSTFQAVRARIGDARARSGKPQRRRAARLLSGLAYCQTCSSKLYVTTSSARPVYKCATSWNGGDGCQGLAVDAVQLEDYVVEQYLGFRGDWPEWRSVTRSSAADTGAALVEIEAALRELYAALDDEDADVPALMARRATLQARRAELRDAPAEESEVWEPTGRTYREAWDAAPDVEAQRLRLSAVVDSVDVARTARRGSFDRERITVRWHEGAEAEIA